MLIGTFQQGGWMTDDEEVALVQFFQGPSTGMGDWTQVESS